MKMVWYYQKNDIEFNLIYFKALKHYKKRIIAKKKMSFWINLLNMIHTLDLQKSKTQKKFL